MAISYTYKKYKDDDIIVAGQDLTVKLYYLSGQVEEVVTEANVASGVEYTLPVAKDGQYRANLSATGEPNTSTSFYVRKFLQNSLIIDIRNLLCKTCQSNNCADDANLCIKHEAALSLKNRGVFVKLLTFQHHYLPNYSENYLTLFNNFITDGLAIAKCKVQPLINHYLQEECLTGSTGEVAKLFRIQLALYWYIMYYIELSIAADVEEEEFVKAKYKLIDISTCLCDTCFTIEDFESILPDPGNGGPTPTQGTVYYWQFNNLVDDIDFVAGIDQDYLDASENITLQQAITGFTYPFGNTGRIALAITTANQDVYRIYDQFNTDVTDVIFDTSFDDVLDVQFYVSKQFYVPSNLYFKLVNS